MPFEDTTTLDGAMCVVFAGYVTTLEETTPLDGFTVSHSVYTAAERPLSCLITISHRSAGHGHIP